MEMVDRIKLSDPLTDAEKQKKYYQNFATTTGKVHLRETEQLSSIIQSYKRMVANLKKEIADRESAEQATRESHELLLTVLNSIDAIVYVADLESHRILFANDYMVKTFGGDVKGKKCFEVIRQTDAPCAYCTNSQLLDDQGNPTDLIVWQDHNPITQKWYSNYAIAIKWPDGRFVRIQFATDISELKQMEEEHRRNEDALRRARQLESIGTLAGGIAHDFNNLLQIIMGNLCLAEDENISTQKRNHYLKGIEHASFKAKELANRLITFSSGGTLNKVAMPIDQLLEKTYQELVHGTSVSCEWSLPPQTWLTPIDNDQMAVALKNVIINACESMSDQGSLKISVENILHQTDGTHKGNPIPAGRYVGVRIQDGGCGIAPGILPKIYEPYFSTKMRGPQKGMGMGLAIVYAIVKRHNGHIFIQSELNVGTTVDIYLPVVGQSGEIHHQPTATPARPLLTDTREILLMDDEEMIQQLAVDMFAYLGYPVDVASDGRAAIARYAAQLEAGKRYLLVILDLTVTGGMGGRQAIKRLIEMDSGVRAIVSSGYLRDPAVTDYREYGFIGVLTKPYSINEVKNLLNRLQSQIGNETSIVN